MTREWIDYADLAQGDLVVEHRHGQVLVERGCVTLTRDEAALAATWADCTVDWLGPHPTPQGAAFAARLREAGQ